MRILVSGSRDFKNSIVFMQAMNDILSELQYNYEAYPKSFMEIVHGGAKGTDSMADMFARSNKIKVKVFTADWNALGKPAGIIRNKEMLKYIAADELNFVIVFNLNNSKGASMVEAEAKKKYPSFVFSTEDSQKLKLATFGINSRWIKKYE